jgi:hypothetical protein
MAISVTRVWSGRYAIREEGIGYNLGRLPPGDIILRSEIGSTGYTWFPLAATRIALHDVARGKALYLPVEGVSRRYVLKCLFHRYLRVSRSIRHYLRCLPTGSISEWAEVRHA